MKRIYLLLSLIGLMTLSCQDDCTQEAYCQLVSTANYKMSSGALITICHNGNTLQVSEQAYQTEGHGQTHTDGTACSDGECPTLSANGLEFRDGEIVEIPCSYELPFMHVAENGTQWYYSKPN